MSAKQETPARTMRQFASQIKTTWRRKYRRALWRMLGPEGRRERTERISNHLAETLAMRPIYQAEEDVIFLVSYPRSGNTWLRNLIAAAIHDVDLSRTPPRLLSMIMPVYEKGYYLPLYDVTFFKTHSLPRPDFKRVIYILRDGRDVMTSYYHYRQARGHDETFLQLVQDETIFPSSWQRHVEQWLANPYGADMLLVRYEDLQRDTLAQMRRICDFAGVSRSDDDLQRGIAQADFSAMKTREARKGTINYEPPQDAAKLDTRRGRVGSHADEMPPDVREAFMQRAGPVLRELGYVK